MNMRMLFYWIAMVTMISCQSKESQVQNDKQLNPTKVELKTTKGNILLELSDKTPLHRDNFLKVIKEGKLDSMLFHRVLEDFVVQAGEYDSLKISRMDSMEIERYDYTVPAEIDTALFHKRGALGAARTGNPDRASASLQFYIVQRGMRLDSLIDADEKRINNWLQQNDFVNAPRNKIWKDSLISAEKDEDWDLLTSLRDTVNRMAKNFPYVSYKIPKYQREIYQTRGGTPHLDQNYTVFGEVISGMPVVDTIATVAVDEAGLPNKNIYILSAKILDE